MLTTAEVIAVDDIQQQLHGEVSCSTISNKRSVRQSFSLLAKPAKRNKREGRERPLRRRRRCWWTRSPITRVRCGHRVSPLSSESSLAFVGSSDRSRSFWKAWRNSPEEGCFRMWAVGADALRSREAVKRRRRRRRRCVCVRVRERHATTTTTNT